MSENKKDYRYVSRLDADYPYRLERMLNPPAGIYVKGRLPDENVPSVAIIGSRLCSQYGRLAAEEFGRVLALNGVQVISGLARGIDGIAQLAASEAGGSSFGILGCGVNVVYPAENKRIYEKVLENGGLISQFKPDASPMKAYFAERNSLISALSDLLLVVEAKERSGTQITVRCALEQGRDIYAVPGRINDICSAGCNELIAAGAGIAVSPEIVLNALGIYPEYDFKTDSVKEKRPKLERLEKKVYEQLDLYAMSLGRIAILTRIPVPELSTILFHLMLKGYVREEGRNYYARVQEDIRQMV